MLLVKTELRESPIHGVGVFLLEPVNDGDIIWTFHPGLDKTFAEGFPELLPEPANSWFTDHASLENGEWLLDGDNAKYMNHSERPNVVCTEEGLMVADKDLDIGDELTCNYLTFCEHRRKEEEKLLLH